MRLVNVWKKKLADRVAVLKRQYTAYKNGWELTTKDPEVRGRIYTPRKTEARLTSLVITRADGTREVVI